MAGVYRSECLIHYQTLLTNLFHMRVELKLFEMLSPWGGGEQVLKVLYDKDIVDEKAFLDWADEKEHAEEHERVFLAKAARFITWLREAEEEDEEETDEESDGSE